MMSFLRANSKLYPMKLEQKWFTEKKSQKQQEACLNWWLIKLVSWQAGTKHTKGKNHFTLLWMLLNYLFRSILVSPYSLLKASSFWYSVFTKLESCFYSTVVSSPSLYFNYLPVSFFFILASLLFPLFSKIASTVYVSWISPRSLRDSSNQLRGWEHSVFPASRKSR